MLSAIGQGALFGIALCFSIGPAFFALIQTSLKYGYKSGMAMAIGIFLSDLTYLFLAYFGISEILTDKKYALPVGILGGTLLIGYGLYQSLKKTVLQKEEEEGAVETKKVSLGGMTLKGYIMNLLNPFILFLWLGALSLATNKLDHDYWKIVAFFTATLITVLGTDILKSLAAGKIKSYLNEKTIHQVNFIAGIILIVSGIILLIRIYVEKPWEG